MPRRPGHVDEYARPRLDAHRSSSESSDASFDSQEEHSGASEISIEAPDVAVDISADEDDDELFGRDRLHRHLLVSDESGESSASDVDMDVSDEEDLENGNDAQEPLEMDLPDNDGEAEEDENLRDREQYAENMREAGNIGLFDGAPLTVGESLYMVLTFSLNHGLTGKCIADLLELIAHHCPAPNNCVKTLYYFKKFFATLDLPIKRHYYCSSCLCSLRNIEDECDDCESNEKSYFVTLPLIPQLQSMFKRAGFYEKLSYRFNRVKNAENNFEDIYDGSVYKEFSENGGFLSDNNSISFCWNSDGVPIFKSSKYSIWPFFLRINELPYHDRVRRENTILAALWFGPQKPLVNAFLLPLLPELQSIRDGINLTVPGHENPVIIRGMILCGTCDMPAKATFLNFKMYNGYFGCTACKQRGMRLPDKKHVYRYEHNVPLRSDEETEEYAAAAQEQGEAVVGVKGPSILFRLVPRPVTGTAIDPMHKYSGVLEKLMVIWFTPKFNRHPASLSHFLPLIEKRFLDVKPPGYVERLPRSLTNFSYFKIKEIFYWLFYYSLVSLNNLMTARYFDHLKMLVNGLFLLNQNSITPENIRLSKALLTEFVVQFEDLYGLEHMTCNIHQLQHLPDFVERLGPLWTITCAPFESMNGTLKSYVHGTRYADLQMCTAASLYADLSVFRDRYVREEGAVQSFCLKMTSRQKRLRLTPINAAVAAADKLVRADPVPDLVRDALLDANVELENVSVFTFKKAFFNRQLFIAESYTRTKKTMSSCVKFKTGNITRIGIIKAFVRVSDCICNILCDCPGRCFAVVTLLETRHYFGTPAPRSVLKYAYQSYVTDNTVAVRVEDFICLCFYAPVYDAHTTFVFESINTVETDD